jgi:branched-chain amino acid transport system substrate-binding protein
MMRPDITRRAMVCAAALLLIGSAATAEELKIGAIGVLSGAGTEWGQAVQRGTGLVVDAVNAAGGLKIGGKSYNPKIIMYDDQYTAQGGTTAATRLVNVDEVKFVIGPVGSPAVLGAINVTGPAKVVVLSNGYSPKILTPESKYNFRIQITTNEFAPAVAAWLKKAHPQAKRVGILSPNDAVGQSVTPIQVKSYTEAGFEVAFEEKYDRGLADFSSLITRMMTRNVDIFDLDSNAPGDAGLMLKQARQLGYKGVIIQTGGPGIEEIIKVAGPLSEGFLSYDIFDPKLPEVQDFLKAYKAKYEGPLLSLTPIYYNAMGILLDAMRQADSIDAEKVRAQLEKMDGTPTLFGKLRWSGQELYGIRHQLLHDFFVSEVKGGKIETIARLSAAQ